MPSATTGFDKGIRILSNLNGTVAVTIMGFVLIFGPTSFILEAFTHTVGDCFWRLLRITACQDDLQSRKRASGFATSG